MTKLIKFITVLVTIVILVVFTIAISYVKGDFPDSSSLTASYSARKDDLQKQEQQLARIISDLNETLQNEKLREQTLASQYGDLTGGQSSTSSNTQNNQPSQPQNPIPTPKPTPIPNPPTTGAS